jgi:hypothetical protein
MEYLSRKKGEKQRERTGGVTDKAYEQKIATAVARFNARKKSH